MSRRPREATSSNRIRTVRLARGLSLEALAELSGISISYLSRMEVGDRNVSVKNLSKLAKALGVGQGELIELGTITGTVTVMGHLQAGEWDESPQWPEDEWYEVSVPEHPAYKAVPRYGAVVRGQSMNRIYPEGTVLIWTALSDTGEEMRDGSRYVVERKGLDGKYEMTVKTYRLAPDGREWLVPESDDPAFQAPIPILGDATEEVTVKGRVIQSVRHE